MLLEILDMELVGEKYVPNHRLVTLKWIMILMLEEQKQVREVASKVPKYWRLRTSLLCIENCYLARNKLLLCSLSKINLSFDVSHIGFLYVILTLKTNLSIFVR